MVSPSTRPMTRNGAPSTAGSSLAATTGATGTPAPAAARQQAGLARHGEGRAQGTGPHPLQDQRPRRTVEGVEQVEGPGLARRAAGQAGHGSDLGALLVEGGGQEVPQRPGDVVGPHRAGP